MKINVDPAIKLSDILTSLSFLLAVLALIFTLQKDRVTSDRAQVTNARSLLSSGLGRLDRWGALSDSAFDEAQPALVQATEIWAKDGNVVVARDYLWRELNGIFQSVDRRILDEKLTSSYIDLYTLSRDMPDEYRMALNSLHDLSGKTRLSILSDTEEIVLSFEQRTGVRVTAEMGNLLRTAIVKDRQDFHDKFITITAALSRRILASLAKSDDDLLAELRSQRL
jgi:hypothetical protein